MRILFSLVTFILGVHSTILSNTGCTCALTAAAANGTGTLGCTAKLDWVGQTSQWCLTDKTSGQCGTYYSGFGYADNCSQAGFPSVTLVPPVYLEWDQSGYTFYTGQTLTVNWTSYNIASSEWLKLTYQGVSLRTLTTGSGVNVTSGTYSSRISDSANSLTSVPVPIILSTTSPALSANTGNISVLQSKIVYVNVYNNNTLVTTGSSLPCDNRNITIQWRGLGEAGVGIASVTVKSNGGFGATTVGSPLTGLIASGNMTVSYLLPRSFIPSGGGGTTYSAQISVQSPGTGVTPYTLSSLSFGLTAAPSQTPTVTTTSTPTPSLSFGSTASNTPSSSITPTQTPTPSLSTGATASITPTLSLTSSLSASQSQSGSTTSSPTPPVDLAVLSAAAAAASLATLEIVIGASIGGIFVMCILGCIGYRVHQRRLLQDKRTRRLSTARRQVIDRASVYGVITVTNETNPRYINNLAYTNRRVNQV